MSLVTVTKFSVFKRTTAQSSTLPDRDKFSVGPGQKFAIKHAFRVGEHCLVHLDEPLGAIGRVGYFYLPHVQVTVDELRGVWLTNIDSDILDSRSNIQQGLQQLKLLGFNTIYPVVWQRGYTLYPSPVTEKMFGHAITPDPRFADRDMLSELIDVAQELNLRVIPWFEYGLMTPPGSPLDRRYPHLIMQDQRGQTIRIKTADRKPDQNVWLNPCHPEVQQFLVELVVDVVERYDIDGIQLDDHFGCPIELGFDSFTQDLYRAEHAGRPLPTVLKHPDRVQWMSSKVNRLLLTLVNAVKLRQPDCLISMSPNPLGFSQSNYLADWLVWYNTGLIDELVLQLYRDQESSFVKELTKSEVMYTRDRIPVSIGILSGLKQQGVSSRWINQQIKLIRKHAFAGVVFFFYETLMYETLAPNRIARKFDDLGLA